MPRVAQTFYASIHLKLYRSFMLFPAGKKQKSKIKIYKKILKEVSREFEVGHEFIASIVKTLCSQEGIFAEEVRLFIFLNKKT